MTEVGVVILAGGGMGMVVVDDILAGMSGK